MQRQNRPYNVHRQLNIFYRLRSDCSNREHISEIHREEDPTDRDLADHRDILYDDQCDDAADSVCDIAVDGTAGWVSHWTR